MSQIAVFLNTNNIVSGYADENSAQAQSKIEGWSLVDSDPAFLSTESYLWTIRPDDNKLVYISDNKTSGERSQTTITELTKGHLNNEMAGVQLQTAVTELTKQVADLTVKLDKANGVDSAPETPTDVTSTATTNGATVTSK